MDRASGRIYDEYLVAATIAGDEAARVRLVDRWQPRLLRHARRVLGDAERARDMVQDAWIAILRGLPGLDDTATFPAWAFRIVTRRCQREFGRSGREVPQAIDDESTQSATPDARAAPGESAAELSVVMDAIGTLPAPQRAALALFYIEGLSVAEIAVATDVPPGTVKTRLMHARRKVRERLEGEHR